MAATGTGVYFYRDYSRAQPLRTAEQKIHSRHLEEAERILAEYLKKNPRDPRALLLQARLDRFSQRFAESRTHIKQAVQFGGETPEIKLENALLLAQSGQLPQVLEDLQTLVVNDHPFSPLILEAMAEGYFRNYRWGEAMYCVRLWLAKEPDRIPALSFRGRLNEQMGRNDFAVADYRDCLKQDPEQDAIRLRLATILLSSVSFEPNEAVMHLEHLLKRRGDDFEIRRLLAQAYREVGRYDDSQELLDALLKERPDSPELLTSKGRLTFAMGRPEEAEPWLRKAATASPGDYQTIYALTLCLNQLQKTEEAAKYQAIGNRILADLDRMHEISSALIRDPSNTSLRHEAGVLAFRCGQSDDAISWFLGALKEDPNHIPSMNSLAEVFEKKGDSFQANRYREKARQASGVMVPRKP